MYITWPYVPSTRTFEPGANLNPAHTKRRIADDMRNEGTIMYTHLHGVEPHVRAAIDRHLEEARRAELHRSARGDRQGRIARIAINIRIRTGLLLITVGQRLRQDQRQNAPTTSFTKRTAGTA